MAIEILENQGRVIYAGIILTIVLSVALFFLTSLQISAGLLAGFLLSLINYYLLNLTIDKGAKYLQRRTYQFIAVSSYFVRLTILAILIYWALINIGSEFIFAAILGLLLLKGLFFIAYVKSLMFKR